MIKMYMMYSKLYGEDEVEIVTNICAWYDLLGYGQPFIEAKWNLKDSICKNNFDRITSDYAYMEGAYSNQKNVTKLFLNDGIASCIDVNENESDSIYDMLCFLEGSVRDYGSLNGYDKGKGYPGVRGIITSGHRFSYNAADTIADMESERDFVFHPAMFQMNTAFSKAFIMDEAGSKSNISGAYLYIDSEIFELIEKVSSHVEGYGVKKSVINDRFEICIFYDDEMFLKFKFDMHTVPFDKKGIDTELYKLLFIDSKFQHLAVKREAMMNKKRNSHYDDNE